MFKELIRSWNRSQLPSWAKIMVSLMMILLMISFLFPLYYMLANTFKDTTQYYTSQFALPSLWSFENYKVMFVDFDIMRYFTNSIVIACADTVFTLLIGIIGGYTFAKVRFKGKEIVYIMILSTMFIPGQAMMIPQYVMFSKLKLINNFMSVILTNVAGSIPAAVMLMRTAFRGVPNDLLESARIDGAGYFRTMFKIAVPVSSATIVIQIIFTFLGSWNGLLTPMLFLTDGNKQTIMVALSNLVTRMSANPTRQLTGLLLSVVPTLILYICLQKYMIKGMLSGAVKS